MSYNNYSSSYDYDQHYGQPSAAGGQQDQHPYTRQYQRSTSGGSSEISSVVQRGGPPPVPSPQQRLPASGDPQQQYAAVWAYQQQQALMARYSAQQQPPIYPPPAYAYPQYHNYPQGSPVPTQMGYYSYPQPPAPSAYQNSQSAIRPGMVPPPPEQQRRPEPPPEVKPEPAPSSEPKEVKTKQPIVVGKRRGGRVLPTGVVKKQKTDETTSQVAKDPWSQYLHEVKKYKDESCEDDNRKNRPLVK